MSNTLKVVLAVALLLCEVACLFGVIWFLTAGDNRITGFCLTGCIFFLALLTVLPNNQKEWTAK